MRCSTRSTVLLCAALIFPARPLVAQRSDASGAFGVGLRVVHELDRSRTVGPRRDFEGRERPGKLAYPVQIRVWYPAAPAAGATRMTFGDYLLLSGSRDGARPVTEADRVAARDGLRSFARFGLAREITDSQASALMEHRLGAVRDASPAPGRFPVVVAGTDGSSANGALLFELLASRGYVVVAGASRPALGAIQATRPALAIDTRIRSGS